MKPIAKQMKDGFFIAALYSQTRIRASTLKIQKNRASGMPAWTKRNGGIRVIPGAAVAKAIVNLRMRN